MQEKQSVGRWTRERREIYGQRFWEERQILKELGGVGQREEYEILLRKTMSQGQQQFGKGR